MAELQDELLKKCIVCGGENSRKNPCTKKPKIEDVSDTLDRCQLLKNSGDHEVTPLLQRLLRAQGENLLGSVRYHSECRKPIMHEKRKRSYSESAISKTPAKPGRPAVLSPEARPKRSASAMPPKEARCMFSSCTFCTTDPYTDVHKVLTDAMGEKLIYIKNNTKVDSVRVCVSDLEGIGKASSLEKHYHVACLRNAQRSCDDKVEGSRENLSTNICDELLVLSVKSSLCFENEILNMKDINEEYSHLLKSYGVKHLSFDQKKYLKDLLKSRIPGIQFLDSKRKNESQTVSLTSHVSEAMDFALSYSTPVESMITLANMMREEALQYRDWKFEKDLNDFECPPMLQFFLNQFLFGRFSKKVTGKRDLELQSTLEVSCQFLLQNLKTDRQVKHTSRRDEGFRSNIETPLSVGLPLAIHTNARDKATIDRLNQLGLGKNYQFIVNIEKRTEQAVLERLKETGSFCLPDFVKKGVILWLDLLEDTP